MAFFPLANSAKADGYCTLHNYPPNDWEPTKNCAKTVWAIYSNGHKWITKELDVLEVGSSKTYFYADILSVLALDYIPLILLQFRKSPLQKELEELPGHEFTYHKVPEWRATVGFSLNQAQTSYQGEINPFPSKASLLTFHPFIQYNEIDNYLLFMNAEKSPFFRSAHIEIYDSLTKKFMDKVAVKSNQINEMPLNHYGFKEDQLPVFICRTMAGIPFGFGVSKDKKMLSLEHTHPPASFAVHGNRFAIQGKIKQQWFDILKPILT